MNLLTTVRALPGGARVTDAVTRLAKTHDTSVVGHVVRAATGLPGCAVPMYWWSRTPNFGDALSPVVVAHMSRGTPVLVSRRYRGKLIAAGSVVDASADGDWVWGAGAISSKPLVPPPGVKFRAVRGPLTRGVLQADVPEVYGDPIMLLPRVFAPDNRRVFEVGLVPHLVDIDALELVDPRITTIDVRLDWRRAAKRITQCQAILSSSLHGLIAAEAFGIPAVWVTFGGMVRGGGFKFRDYYLSTGREPPEPVPWNIALRDLTRLAKSPPVLDVEPLLRAWPEEIAFPA